MNETNQRLIFLLALNDDEKFSNFLTIISFVLFIKISDQNSSSVHVFSRRRFCENIVRTFFCVYQHCAAASCLRFQDLV